MTSPATAAGAAAGTGAGTGGQGGGVQPGSGSSATGQGERGQGSQTQGSQTGGTPAAGQGSDNGLYAEYLRDVPTQLHGTVTEALKKMEGYVTKNQQEVRSQLAPFQPLIDQGAKPEQLQAAHQMLTWLQEDPAEGLQLIAAELGVDLSQLVGDGGGGQQQPAGTPGGMPDEGLGAGQGDLQDGAPPSWFTQFQEQTFGPIQEMVNLMAQAQVQQHQGQQQEQEINQLEQLLQSKGIQLQEGDPKLGFVLGQLALADDESVPTEQLVDAAVQQWDQMQTQFGGQQQAAQTPPVLPAGGGMPTQQVNPQSLSPKDRRALAVQRATELMAQSRG